MVSDVFWDRCRIFPEKFYFCFLLKIFPLQRQLETFSGKSKSTFDIQIVIVFVDNTEICMRHSIYSYSPQSKFRYNGPLSLFVDNEYCVFAIIYYQSHLGKQWIAVRAHLKCVRRMHTQITRYFGRILWNYSLILSFAKCLPYQS